MAKHEHNHKIFYRRKLPHLQPLEGTFFITYRLYNSLPKSLLKQLKIEFEFDKMNVQRQFEGKQEALNHVYQEYFRKLDEILDKIVGGVSYLKDEKVAKIIADSLHYKAGLCENRKDWRWSYICEEYNEYL